MTDANAERLKIARVAAETEWLRIEAAGQYRAPFYKLDCAVAAVVKALDAHDAAQMREKEDRMWALRISPVAPILAPRAAVPAEVTEAMVEAGAMAAWAATERLHGWDEARNSEQTVCKNATRKVLQAALAAAHQGPEAPQSGPATNQPSKAPSEAEIRAALSRVCDKYGIKCAPDHTAADRKIAEAARKIAGQCWPVEYRALCAAIAERFGGRR